MTTKPTKMINHFDEKQAIQDLKGNGVSRLTLRPRPPCLLIDGQIVELPPQSAESLARSLARALTDLWPGAGVAP
jgi:hypothetical protein